MKRVNVSVFLLEDWLDTRGRPFTAGTRMWIPAQLYRVLKGLGLVGRELIRCRRADGYEYWHAANCGGGLLMPTAPRPTILDATKGEIPPPPSYTRTTDNPAVPAAMGPPPAGVVRAGCGGCAKQRKEAAK